MLDAKPDLKVDEAVALALPIYRIQAEHGGIADIARRAGITRTTLYRRCLAEVEKDRDAKRKIAPSADTERGDGHLNGDESATADKSTPDAGGTGNKNGDRE